MCFLLELEGTSGPDQSDTASLHTMHLMCLPAYELGRFGCRSGTAKPLH